MSKAELYALAAKELELYGVDFDGCKIQTKDGSGPQGGFVLFWKHNNKSGRVGMPHDSSNPGEAKIFRSTLKKSMREAGIEPRQEDATLAEVDNLKGRIEQIEQSLKELGTTYSTRIEGLAEEVKTVSELALEKAAQMENIVGLFHGLMAAKPIVPEPKIVPKQSEYPKVAIAPIAIQKAPTPEQILAKKRAEAVAEIESDMFEIDDFEGHILHFLHKCGPHTAHELRESGMWKTSDSISVWLEDMGTKGLVRFLRAEGRFSITTKGIQELAGEPETGAEPVEPEAKEPGKGFGTLAQLAESNRAAVLKSMEGVSFTPERRILYWLDKMGEQSAEEIRRAGLAHDCEPLGDRLRYLEGEKKWICYGSKGWVITDLGKAFLDTPKPKLVTVEPEPVKRILKPVAVEVPKQANLVDSLVLHLYQKGEPQTVNEMKDAGLRGYGERNDVYTVAYNAKAKSGYVRDAGAGKWELTKAGIKRAEELLGADKKPPIVQNDDLRRQFR